MFLKKKMLQNMNWESKRIMRINNYLKERMGIAP